MGVVTIEQLNVMDYEEFIHAFGNVLEHCPLFAAVVWAQKPFQNLTSLHSAICSLVDELPPVGREGLLRVHPDLAGKVAESGSLTNDSSREQEFAGLGKELTQQERSTLQNLNTRYKEKFGFPFVICARENKKQAIMSGIKERLDNDKDKERAAGIAEVKKIVFYRLLDIVQPNEEEAKL